MSAARGKGEQGLHIHLDPVGGIAGDMFTAALLDAWPELAAEVTASIARCGLASRLHMQQASCTDGTLTGSRFDVTPTPAAGPMEKAEHVEHTHWRQIRQMLEASELDPPVKTHAIGIFTALAEAEAGVHGMPVNAVVFHEVGNLDSIADIVAAATLIARVGASSWSVGALPSGAGRVQSAHGLLPVPAPATLELLAGFTWFDDGVAGERVTPTGAAILHYLKPAASLGTDARRLACTGHGFGSRRLPGLSNVLRITAWRDADRRVGHSVDRPVDRPDDRALDQHVDRHPDLPVDRQARGQVSVTGAQAEPVAVLEFEIDDQSGESLAVGLDALRTLPAVLDVVTLPAIGKKGRMMSAVRVLARPDAVDSVAEACFRQTTTLGVRVRIDERLRLERQESSASGGDADAPPLNVKRVERPGGATAKADIDGVLPASGGTGSHREREWQRSRAENEVLERYQHSQSENCRDEP